VSIGMIIARPPSGLHEPAGAGDAADGGEGGR
jgi:hypothetical protein